MRKVDNNIWVVEKDFRFSGTDFGNRMTIIRLPSGRLVLHSPVVFSYELLQAVNEIGEVGIIITPNNFHGLYAADWCEEFPQAQYYSAHKKDTGEARDLSLLLNENKQEMESAIEVMKIDGIPKLNEFVFYHKESATLVLTDLAFNFNEKISLWSKVFFKLNDCYNKFGPSRLMKSLVDSPDDLYHSIERMQDFEFDRIIVSHGDLVEVNAREKFDSAFSKEKIGVSRKKAGFKLNLSSCG